MRDRPDDRQNTERTLYDGVSSLSVYVVVYGIHIAFFVVVVVCFVLFCFVFVFFVVFVLFVFLFFCFLFFFWGGGSLYSEDALSGVLNFDTWGTSGKIHHKIKLTFI